MDYLGGPSISINTKSFKVKEAGKRGGKNQTEI